MNISIIGSGALGKAYGGLLAHAGLDVHFLMRSEFKNTQQKGHFVLLNEQHPRPITISNPKIYEDTDTLPPSDFILIATKTTGNHELASLLTSCLKKDSIILIIQNGIGNEEWLAKLAPGCPIVCGISSMGANRIDAESVAISYAGELKLAPLTDDAMWACEKIQALFQGNAFNIPVKIRQNYKELRWHKLAWNIPFGALSIIFDKTTCVLAKEEPYLTIVRALIEEVISIAASEGIHFSDLDPREWISFTQKTSGYYPSMYRDFKSGKAIEKEYLFENPLKIAQQNHVVVPYLSLVNQYLNFATE